MNKKIISISLIIAMLMPNMLACDNIAKKTSKPITADTPYYSVTIGNEIRERNVYMDLEIEIPKITYSNEENNALIDSINTEIESKLNTLINEAKENASKTYTTYLESAKENAKKDIEYKLSEIKNKYKNIIGEEEVKQLSEFTVDDVARFPMFGYDGFSRSSFSNAFPQFDTDNFPQRNRWATPNNMRRNDFQPFDSDNFPQRNKWATPNNINKDNFKQRNDKWNKTPNNKNDNNRGRVDGFTGTEDLIIPGLHNKNIIIVETSESKVTETSIKVDGKPGKAPSEFQSGNFPSDSEKTQGRKQTESIAPSEESKDAKKESKKISTKSEVTETAKGKIDESEIIPAEISEADADKGLTLDDFYREFAAIRRIRIPDDYTLAIQYIPTTISCRFEVKCLDEDYLSLFIELGESRTTSNIKRLFYNIDLNDKKIVTIKDILGNNYKEKCTSAITEAINKWSDEQKSALIDNYNIDNYIKDDTPFFINNNHRPVIQIEKFVITIGSAGYHEFQIP